MALTFNEAVGVTGAVVGEFTSSPFPLMGKGMSRVDGVFTGNYIGF